MTASVLNTKIGEVDKKKLIMVNVLTIKFNNLLVEYMIKIKASKINTTDLNTVKQHAIINGEK